MTYTPTDEQSEALWEATGVVDQPHARRFTDAELGKHLAASPAFQAIIRAAQAQALRDYADRLDRTLEDIGMTAGDVPVLLRHWAFLTENPYVEAGA